LLFATIAAAGQADEHEGILRLHILAADDTPAEQELKIAVRDGVWEHIAMLMEAADSRETAMAIIEENIGVIEAQAQAILAQHGSEHRVTARLAQNLHFPAMVYNMIFLPAARYTALQIVIGDGAGSNWWCILFPTLCLTELATAQPVLPIDGLQQVNLRPRLRIADLWR